MRQPITQMLSPELTLTEFRIPRIERFSRLPVYALRPPRLCAGLLRIHSSALQSTRFYSTLATFHVGSTSFRTVSHALAHHFFIFLCSSRLFAATRCLSASPDKPSQGYASQNNNRCPPIGNHPPPSPPSHGGEGRGEEVFCWPRI